MADITVIGGINIDIEGKPDGILKFEDSNPGKISVSYGGVGRNITENVARMGGSVAMISVIGEDHMGYGAKEHLRLLGVDVSRIEVKKHAMSAMYLSILNDKSLIHKATKWINVGDEKKCPTLEITDEIKVFDKILSKYTKEDIAFAIQYITESRVKNLLKPYLKKYKKKTNKI